MTEAPARRWFADGYILTVDDDGLHVEATDGHAKPLHLGWGKLCDLGLSVEREKPVRRWPEGVREPAKSGRGE